MQVNRKLKLIFFSVAIVYCGSCFSQSNPTVTVKKIIFIRHGEKPEQGDNLSCKGLNRSLQLPAVLLKKFGVVDHILVPALKNGNSTNHSRMFQTISPYAIQQHLNINTKFDESESKAIANAITYLNGTVLLVWEHKSILKILKELGIKENIQWRDNDYDSIIIITYKNGIPILKRDTENLNPADKCNY
jgi:hypothetical protein